MLDAMAISAIEFGAEIDEFVEAGLTPAPSITIATPRIAESRVSLECRLHQIVPIGPMRSLVMSEVLLMRVADAAVLDGDRGWINTEKLELIGRMGPNRYVRTGNVVERIVPTATEWKTI